MFVALFKGVYKSSVGLVRVMWSRLVLTGKRADSYVKLPGSKRRLEYTGTAKADSCSIQLKSVVYCYSKALINSYHKDKSSLNQGGEV